MPHHCARKDSEDALVVGDAPVVRDHCGHAKLCVVSGGGWDQTGLYPGHTVDRARGVPGKGCEETGCTRQGAIQSFCTAPTGTMPIVSKSHLLEFEAK